MQVSFSNGRYTLPEYPFRVPPELSGARSSRHPVVIVGAGLVGLTAACALAQLGVPVVVLDEDNTVGVRGISSRGVCYARKSLEIFDRLGIYRRMLGKGVRWTVGRTFDGERQVFEFDLASDARRLAPAAVHQPAAVLRGSVPHRARHGARQRGPALAQQGRELRAGRARRDAVDRDSRRRVLPARGLGHRLQRRARRARRGARSAPARHAPPTTAGASRTSSSTSPCRSNAIPG